MIFFVLMRRHVRYTRASLLLYKTGKLMENNTFGELRSLLNRDVLGVLARQELWHLIKEAARTSEDKYHEEVLPYLKAAIKDSEQPLAVVSDVDYAQQLVPFATFEASLSNDFVALVDELHQREVPLLETSKKAPLPKATLEALIQACPFVVEPVMVEFYQWCDGITVEFLDDRDKEGQPFDDASDWDITYRRLTIHGAHAYFQAAPADVVSEVDEEIDDVYIEFLERASDDVDEGVDEDDISEALTSSTRFVADYTSSSNDLTCANIRLTADNRYEYDNTGGEWTFEVDGRSRTLRGCTAWYVGTMRLKGTEFSLYRDLVDSEIAEVVTEGTVKEVPVSTILRALLTQMMAPSSNEINRALHAYRQHDH